MTPEHSRTRGEDVHLDGAGSVASAQDGGVALDTCEVPESTAAPGLIGPYHLLELIGEGGMGQVWLAEQKQPVRRRVAIKLIKAGMDTREVITRFESERQALALMDHPAIAKVFDAGSTPQGRPYFVMEYVAGMPITDWCDKHKLTMRQRMELFILVCEGVQHAHQKAIIHRDLKPSNILVSEILTISGCSAGTLIARPPGSPPLLLRSHRTRCRQAPVNVPRRAEESNQTALRLPQERETSASRKGARLRLPSAEPRPGWRRVCETRVNRKRWQRSRCMVSCGLHKLRPRSSRQQQTEGNRT
jgi:serine/threonine protein kinase